MAYLTPGGQAVQQFQSKVNAFWKPILLFGEAVDWLGDVCSSDANDNDKEHHEWGQSESGMSNLIERLSKPGQLICDPFVGGGTTAVVSLKLGRRFVGCDIDENCVKRSIERCKEIYATRS
jgi:site-specific DNA-methyltransferase (adenine-specific)